MHRNENAFAARGPGNGACASGPWNPGTRGKTKFHLVVSFVIAPMCNTELRAFEKQNVQLYLLYILVPSTS